MSLPALKLPGKKRTREIEIDEEDTISTSRFFPTNPEKLQRRNIILDAEYDIPNITDIPRCSVSIVIHMHGQIPVVIKKTETKENDVDFIVKEVPNSNTISTRLMAPAGEVHIEHEEGDDECPEYNSSLRFIYVSRMRLFSNLQCLSQVHFNESQPVKFLPRRYYNEDFSGYSEEGLADFTQFPDFKKYIDNPNYCQYFPEKREYAEKVFSSSLPLRAPTDEQLFGIYIDIAIIKPKVDDPTKNTVTVKTFILSNTSEDFIQASLRYIEELLVEGGNEKMEEVLVEGGNPKIKQELKEFIKSGTCKLSTIINAISSYTQNKRVPDGNTSFFLTDLSCSVYKTFDDTPRKYKKIERVPVTSIEQDERNRERTSHLFDTHRIPENYKDDFINDECTGYDAGCGLLTFAEIESKTLSKEQIEREEYTKIFTILKSKLSELRGYIALGGSLIFNKRQRRTKRGGKRRTKQGSKRRRHTTKKIRRKKQ
jgi:hypothetical protein